MVRDNGWQGFVFGAVGGIAGLVAMRFYWKAARALTGEDPRMLTREEPPDTLDEVGVAGQLHEEEESSTAALGRMAYEAVTGDEPEDEQTQKALSYGVHWGYGIATAGLYGAVRGSAGWPDVAGGLLFGTALWTLGDEVAVPLLGLSKGPTAFPLEQHAHRFGAHVAFGLATSAATQGLYHLFRPSS